MIKRLLIPTALLALSGCAVIPNHYTSSDWLGDDRFTDGVEGPAVDRGGRLYAVNFERQGTIGVSQVRGQGRLYVTLPEGSIANAIRFTDDGNMLVADYTGHNILKVDTRTREVSVYAHSDKMHQPNDLVIADDGTVYASDPNWADGTGQLWRIDPEEEPQLIESGMGTTNGIELSPDGQTLYVNESVQRVIWAYDRAADGSLSNKRIFHRFAEHGLDGMSVDIDGNLYVARYGAGEIAILNPAGELMRTVALKGQHPTNLTFGGPDGQRVFVTMQKRGAIETFTVPTPGSDWTKARQ